MIVTTTPGIEGQSITRYCGVVAGEAILGANMFKDMFAGIRDLVGGAAPPMNASCRRHARLRCANCRSAQPPWARTPWSAWTWTTRCWARATAC